MTYVQFETRSFSKTSPFVGGEIKRLVEDNDLFDYELESIAKVLNPGYNGYSMGINQYTYTINFKRRVNA